MSIDEALRSNAIYSLGFFRELPASPARRLAIVTCMDSRMFVEPMLGLRPGEAHIIRNAGGIATEDVIRSLIVSYHILGTREVMIINHTDCGLLGLNEDDLRSHLLRTTGAFPPEPQRFYSFTDLEANVREQVGRVQSHPWLPDNLPVRGFVYNVRTGRLTEVSPYPPGDSTDGPGR